jgi:hypothetical protein
MRLERRVAASAAQRPEGIHGVAARTMQRPRECLPHVRQEPHGPPQQGDPQPQRDRAPEEHRRDEAARA